MRFSQHVRISSFSVGGTLTLITGL